MLAILLKNIGNTNTIDLHFTYLFKAINDLNRKKSRSSISVKNENGKLISDPELVRNRWKEYIEKLYMRKANPIVSMLNQQRMWMTLDHVY